MKHFELSYINGNISATTHATLEEAMREASCNHRINHYDSRMVWVMVMLGYADEHWQGFEKYPAEEATCVICQEDEK